jgi:hypothetical protein
VVGSLGSDLTGFHHFTSGNGNGVFEAVHVPSLKEGEVQTDVCWVEGFFMGDLYEEAGEVFYVVHFLLSVFGYRLSVFCSRLSVIHIRYSIYDLRLLVHDFDYCFFFFWLDPKETKGQDLESSSVKFILEF